MKANVICRQPRGTRLNLGCGPDRRTGFVNVDILPGADVQHDLNIFPWPWEDESVNDILMFHVLEHLSDTYGVMREVKRILKPGGRFYGQVPHCFSKLAYWNPQHVRYFHQQALSSLAEEFGMLCFVARPGVHSVSMVQKLRNLIPFRNVLGELFLNMWDIIDFDIRKV